MTLLERFQSLIILSAVLAGLGLGQVSWIAQHSGQLILPFLVMMLVGVFLHVPMQDLVSAFRNRKITTLSLLINFVWNPIFAYMLGWLFLHDLPALRIGLIMLMVTPCTDWYLIFTGIARGNVPLSISLLPWNLLLQLLLLPVYLLALAGTLVRVNLGLLGKSVVITLLLPFLSALVVRFLTVRLKGNAWFSERLMPTVGSVQTMFLNLAIVAMFASEGAVVMENPAVLFYLLAPVLLFFVLNLGLVCLFGRLFRIGYQDFVTLCFTTLARNSPIALAIALMTFPDEPLIALALVIGPLIELPILSMISHILLWMRRIGYCVESKEA